MTVYTTADPEALRVTRNYRRHYQLPGYPHPLPSATSIKPDKVFKTRTPRGEYVELAGVRAAEAALDAIEDGGLDTWQADDLFEHVATAALRNMRQAGQRGTNVHDALANVLLGNDSDPRLSDEEVGYFTAGMAFLQDYEVQPIAVEIVVSVPDLEVAGTADWIVHIGGRTVLGDWKTRSGNRHGAYPEEAGQLGIYTLATSMHPDETTVVPMPEIDDILIVSLTEDGSYALYPIDLEKARSTAVHMRTAWAGQQLLQQVGQGAIGTPVVAAPVQQTLEQDALLDQRIAWLRQRLAALTPAARIEASRTWPPDTPRKAAAICAHQEIDRIAACLDHVEAAHGIPFGPTDPAQPPAAPGAGKPKVSL